MFFWFMKIIALKSSNGSSFVDAGAMPISTIIIPYVKYTCIFYVSVKEMNKLLFQSLANLYVYMKF